MDSGSEGGTRPATREAGATSVAVARSQMKDDETMTTIATTPEFKGQGRWYAEGGNLWTPYANQLLNVFCGAQDQPGRYYVRATARNHGVMPPNYTHFEVDVHVLGLASRTEAVDLGKLGAAQARLRIPAATDFRVGAVAVDLPAAASVQLVLVWLNDAYSQGVYDANIEFRAVTLSPAKVQAGQSVAFRNVGTGEYIALKPDPRGGGALEGGARTAWSLYQASGAAQNNFEVKRADFTGFNWSNYDNASDGAAFIAWNHAKRFPNNTTPDAPHQWFLDDLGDGTVHIRHAGGEVCELMPDLRLFIRGSEGPKIITRAIEQGNLRQKWVMELC